MVVRLEAGSLVLPDGTKREIGMYASTIQEEIIDAMFPPVSADDISGKTFFDESSLRYLDLTGGDYLVDEALTLPSMFVLRLDDASSLSVAPNATIPDEDTPKNKMPPALVMLDGVRARRPPPDPRSHSRSTTT
jgi:hypothetical protein